MMFIFTVLLIVLKISFVYYLYNIKEGQKFSRIYRTSFIFGLLSWSFLYTMLPLDQIKEPNNILDFLFISIVIISLSLPNVFYAIVASAVSKLRFINKYIKILIFAIYLAFAEFVISTSVALIMDKSLIPDYAFTNLGLALAHSPLAYFAKYGHVYILTFLLAAILAFISEFKNENYRHISLLVLFIFAISLYNNPSDLDYENSKVKAFNNPDKVLIGAEDSRIVNFSNYQELKSKYDLVVDGDTEVDDLGNMYNVSNIYDMKNEKQYVVYKRFLMPFGEFFPSGFSFLKYINNDLYQNILKRRSYVSVDKNKIFEFDGKTFAILLCSDAWSPVTASKIKDQNPDYIILQRSERLFHDRSLYEANVLMWKSLLQNYFDTTIIDKRI
ncbi:MAG: hypothetical protein QG614_343 [Patescibacteria group bacterium]|nr:hypothetical protein [Patescibacteria group bacterium]